MQKEQSNRATTHLARSITVVVFVLGIVSTIVGSRVSQQRHNTEMRQVFEAECSAMRNAVDRQLTLFFSVLDSISQLHQLSDNISGDELEEFTTKGLQFQKRILSSYGFVQRMPHEIREALSQSPQGGLTILERTIDGSFIIAGVRPEYFPMVYQFPSDSLGVPLGVDMASLPGSREAILRMNEFMGPVIATSLQVQDTDNSSGFFALSPIFQMTEEGRAAFSGFTVSILWPQRILKQALEGVSARDVLVRFYAPNSGSASNASEDPESLSIHEAIVVADQSWTFEAIASPEYLARHQAALPGVILATGFVITLLATLMMLLLANRTRRIESVVQQRTKDLKDANQLLSESMEEQLRLESEILDVSEKEKQQLGHDLHDSLGQKLTGAVFLSRALGSHLETSDTETQDQARRVTEILKDSVAQVRRMARGLSPVELGKEGLPGALHRLAEETSSVYEIACLFHEKENCEPPAKAAHHLYAIALESVNNAIKHGKASEIVIELSQVTDSHSLTVEDNGAGFNPSDMSDNGMGLRIMKYRASMIGGELDVTKRTEGGMKISCEFPSV